jgi:hypothetical protein
MQRAVEFRPTLIGSSSCGLEASCDLVEQVDREVLLNVQGSAVHP